MGVKVNLKSVRVGWLQVFERAADDKNEDGSIKKGKFQLTVFLDPHDKQISKMEAAILEELTEKMKSDKSAEKWMSRNYGFGNHNDKCAVRDLSERDKPIEGLEEGLYFKASSHKKPLIKTSTGETQVERGITIDGDDIEGQEVYSGCIANVSVEFYWYDKFKTLMCNLLGVRFRADGEAFGGAGETASDDDLDDDDEAPRRDKKPRTRRDRDDEDETDEEEEEQPRRRRAR